MLDAPGKPSLELQTQTSRTWLVSDVDSAPVLHAVLGPSLNTPGGIPESLRKEDEAAGWGLSSSSGNVGVNSVLLGFCISAVGVE